MFGFFSSSSWGMARDGPAKALVEPEEFPNVGQHETRMMATPHACSRLRLSPSLIHNVLPPCICFSRHPLQSSCQLPIIHIYSPMPRVRSLRTQALSPKRDMSAGPPSPTFTETTNASVLNFGPDGPEKIITRANLKASLQSYDDVSPRIVYVRKGSY